MSNRDYTMANMDLIHPPADDTLRQMDAEQYAKAKGEPVDVLRWIDDSIDLDEREGYSEEVIQEGRAVRVAVAELIAERDALRISLGEMLELRTAGIENRVTEKHELHIVRDARAALARAGGAK